MRTGIDHMKIACGHDVSRDADTDWLFSRTICHIQNRDAPEKYNTTHINNFISM